MGFLWDLYQQNQISKHHDRANSVEQRLARTEEEVKRLSALVGELIRHLEAKLGTDLDGDGKVS
jgi:hypothetical protein